MKSAFLGLVERLVDQSAALLNHIKEGNGLKEYEDPFIEQIQYLLDERQGLIDQMQHEASRQKSDVKTLVDVQVPDELRSDLTRMEKEISLSLRHIFQNIQNSRKQLREKQHSRQQYRNPFANVKRDGMFIDKRK